MTHTYFNFRLEDHFKWWKRIEIGGKNNDIPWNLTSCILEKGWNFLYHFFTNPSKYLTLLYLNMSHEIIPEEISYAKHIYSCRKKQHYKWSGISLVFIQYIKYYIIIVCDCFRIKKCIFSCWKTMFDESMQPTLRVRDSLYLPVAM